MRVNSTMEYSFLIESVLQMVIAEQNALGTLIAKHVVLENVSDHSWEKDPPVLGLSVGSVFANLALHQVFSKFLQ